MVVLLHIMPWDSFSSFSIQTTRSFHLFNDLVGSNSKNEIKYMLWTDLAIFIFFFRVHWGKNIIHVHISKLGKSMSKNREHTCFFPFKNRSFRYIFWIMNIIIISKKKSFPFNELLYSERVVLKWKFLLVFVWLQFVF